MITGLLKLIFRNGLRALTVPVLVIAFLIRAVLAWIDPNDERPRVQRIMNGIEEGVMQPCLSFLASFLKTLPPTFKSIDLSTDLEECVTALNEQEEKT